MKLRELDIDRYQEQLDKKMNELLIGEHGDRGIVAKAYNDGLETMKYTACTLLLDLLSMQMDADRNEKKVSA